MNLGSRCTFMLPVLLVAGLTSCNPFGCYSSYRSAEYRGLLGSDVAPAETLSVRTPGGLSLILSESTGNNEQQAVSLSVNIWGFADSVEKVELHKKSGTNAGQLLFSTSSGYLVRDSLWNEYPEIYTGPLAWEDFWNTMKNGNAYVELHPASGKPVVKGAIGLVTSSGFQPSCT